MALTTDKTFVTTTDEISGYRIVKYSGVVMTFKKPRPLEKTDLENVISDMSAPLLAKAQGLGANAVVGAKFLMVYAGSYIAEVSLYGTAVIVEPV